MTRVRLTDISPDGIRIVIDWGKFVAGSSVFIPTINTTKAVEHLIKAARINNDEIAQRVCVEGGKYGVRVWRMK